MDSLFEDVEVVGARRALKKAIDDYYKVSGVNHTVAALRLEIRRISALAAQQELTDRHNKE